MKTRHFLQILLGLLFCAFIISCGGDDIPDEPSNPTSSSKQYFTVAGEKWVVWSNNWHGLEYSAESGWTPPSMINISEEYSSNEVNFTWNDLRAPKKGESLLSRPGFSVYVDSNNFYGKKCTIVSGSCTVTSTKSKSFTLEVKSLKVRNNDRETCILNGTLEIPVED